jgi:hypothetical protein
MIHAGSEVCRGRRYADDQFSSCFPGAGYDLPGPPRSWTSQTNTRAITLSALTVVALMIPDLRAG